MIPYILFIALLASLLVLLHFTYNPKGNRYTISKTCCSIIFILISLSGYLTVRGSLTYFMLVFIALILSLFGDVFLAFYDSSSCCKNNFFYYGVISFATAHIFFSIAFMILTPFRAVNLIAFILLSLFSLCFLKLYKGFDFKGMFKVIAAYDLIICFMVSNAFSLFSLIQAGSTKTVVVLCGAALFFISDLVLSLIYFSKKHSPVLSAINLSTYYIGQGLIALSVLILF